MNRLALISREAHAACRKKCAQITGPLPSLLSPTGIALLNMSTQTTRCKSLRRAAEFARVSLVLPVSLFCLTRSLLSFIRKGILSNYLVRSKRFVLCALVFAGCCDESRVPEAHRQLYSARDRDRTEALQVLSRCGTRAESSVQRIAALMYDRNVGVASAAAYALRTIDSEQAREALKRAEEAREHARHVKNRE